MNVQRHHWLLGLCSGVAISAAAACGSPTPPQRRATAPTDAATPREPAPRGEPRVDGTAPRPAARPTEPRPQAARPGDGKTLKELLGKPQFLVGLPPEDPAPPGGGPTEFRGGFGEHSGLSGVRSGQTLCRVRLGGVVTQGAITARQLRRVLRAHREEVRRCYLTQGLARRPTLTGSSTLTFSIRPDGRVASSRVRAATLQSPPTIACLRTALRRWVFPEGTGRRAGTATWSFEPGGVGR